MQDICRDIKALDVAKKHLTTTIETLNRLQMLVTSVHRLEQYVEAHEYIDAGRLLEAVQQLFKLFSEYHGVPTMRDLMERVDAVKLELQQLIEDDFDELTEAGAGEAHSLEDGDSDSQEQSAAVATSLETLRHACAVIDALGGRLLERLIARFCRKQLNRPYERTFGGPDACNLEAVERRYAWFRRTLRDIEARFGRVLPEHWCLPHRLTVAFADSTRADIAGRILCEFDPPSSAPAELLVRALNKTLQFEKEMQKRFEKEGSVAKGGADQASGGGSDGQHGGGAAGGQEVFDESAPLINEDGEVVDPSSAEGIRLKYRKRKEWEQQQAEKKAASKAQSSKASWLQSLAGGKQRGEGSDSGEEGAKQLPQLPSLVRRISDAFDPYMGAYVRLERESLEMIVGDAKMEVQSALQHPDEEGAAAAVPHSVGERDVLASSSKLFQQVKNATSRCVQLNTGNTFFELYLQFKEVLHAYASALETGLPAAAPAKTPSALRFSLGGGSSSAASLPGDTFGLKADSHGLGVLRSVARIVNTAEYVAETLQGLEDTLRNKMEDKLAESVSFADAQDAFFALSAQATKVLGEVTAGMLDQPLTAMVTTDWWTLTEVGDASPYVSELDSCLRAAMPTVRLALIDHPGAYRAFCDKFVRAFTARYMACLYLCQRIGEMGAQQLLLDAQGIRSILLDAPLMEPAESSGDELPVAPLPTVYKNFVSREVPRAEMLLKLLATPEARFAASIKALWSGATAPELQRVMQLRNMSRRSQAAVLAELGLGESNAGADIMGSMGSLLGRRTSSVGGK